MYAELKQGLNLLSKENPLPPGINGGLLVPDPQGRKFMAESGKTKERRKKTNTNVPSSGGC